MIMVEKEEQHQYRRKMTAAFNMAIADLARIDNILAAIDNFYMQCANGDFATLLMYSSGLRALYKYFMPLIDQQDQDYYKKKFEGIEKKLIIDKKFNWSMFKEIEVLHEELLSTRHKIGLGMPANTEDLNFLREVKPEFGGYWKDKKKKK